jgi:hypothetical protein
MKSKVYLSIAAISLFAVENASAASGFFGRLYVITTLNGGANSFNQVTTGTTPGGGATTGHDLSYDGFNPKFTSFGTLDLTDVLSLKGFEYKTWNDNGTNVSHANLFYRIYPTGSPTGSFTQVTMSSPSSTSGNDKTWQTTSGTTNLLSGLSTGDYTMQIYTESYTNGVNSAGNIFGFTDNSPTATFTVIPESSAALLGGLGLLGMLRRRRG